MPIVANLVPSETFIAVSSSDVQSNIDHYVFTKYFEVITIIEEAHESVSPSAHGACSHRMINAASEKQNPVLALIPCIVSKYYKNFISHLKRFSCIFQPLISCITGKHVLYTSSL